MRYVVDRIEGNYVLLEDENKNIIEVLKDNFSFDIYDGMILLFKDGEYFIDEESDILRQIMELKCKVWDK